jgi:flagellar biosynthesis GTPase FlhF
MSPQLSADPSRAVLVPAVRDLARRLLAQGSSPAFARRIVARVEVSSRTGEPEHPLDLAARLIGEAFPRVVLRTPSAGPACLAVLGSRGSGRSAFVRKLALRLCGAGRRVAVLAVRQRDSSSPEWLATWMGEIGAMASVVDESALEVPRACGGADVVLVDGCGEPQRDAAITERIVGSETLRHADWTRVGVLASDAAPERLREDAGALRDVAADCSVLTRLDLATTPAAAFEIASSARLPVAFVCTGKAEANHLHRCEPERVADVFLKGRFA